MLYFNTNTNEVMGTATVRRFVSPTTIPKDFTLDNIKSLGFAEYIDTPKPEPSSTLKTVVAGEPIQTGDSWAASWVEVDMFADIPDGLTKAEQETEYLAAQAAKAISDKKAELKTLFLTKMEKPVIDTGLGFSVDGGRVDLQNFQTGLARGYWFARDSNNEMQLDLTEDHMKQIIEKIQDNGMAIYQRKWALEALIDADPEIDINTGWPE